MRRWLGPVLLATAPVAALASIECVLRLAGVGVAPKFWIADGPGRYRANERFTWRFMPPALARTPAPERIVDPKPDRTLRIFVIGESAAYGVPDPAFGLPRVLGATLQDCFPGRKVEVVSAAVTAVNSHALREVAADCLRHQPDALVVYAGHNEVIGPFGPGTVLGANALPFWQIRAQLWTSSLYLGQWLQHLGEGKAGAGKLPANWGGMAMFLEHRVPVSDARLVRVHEDFAANLADIARAARRCHVPVLLWPAWVNLTDCPPFASMHRGGLSGADLSAWEILWTAGIEAQNRADWQAALDSFRKAVRLDGEYAETHYRMAQCLAALGEKQAALEAYDAALECDALRFRADRTLRAVPERVARETGAVCGPPEVGRPEWFYEHVHLTFDGNLALASAMAARLVEMLGGTAKWPDRAELERRLGYSAWARLQADKEAADMMSKPPFTLQSGFTQRHASRLPAIEEASRRVETPAGFAEARRALDAALADRPADVLLHSKRLDLLRQAGSREDEMAEALRLTELAPEQDSAEIRLIWLLASAGRRDEVITRGQQLLQRRPRSAPAHKGVADAELVLGRSAEARRLYDAALTIRPDYADAHLNLAALLIKEGNLDQAADHLHRTLELGEDVTALANLALIRVRQRRLEDAVELYERALLLKPQSAPFHSNCGAVLLDLGRREEGVKHLEAALRVDPTYERARRMLKQLGVTDRPHSPAASPRPDPR